MCSLFPQRLAGDEYVGFNNAVFLSEREAADRNYALGFYMRENKCFPAKSNLREVMDFYFQVRLALLPVRRSPVEKAGGFAKFRTAAGGAGQV